MTTKKIAPGHYEMTYKNCLIHVCKWDVDQWYFGVKWVFEGQEDFTDYNMTTTKKDAIKGAIEWIHEELGSMLTALTPYTPGCPRHKIQA
jgi:hypothetical protein